MNLAETPCVRCLGLGKPDHEFIVLGALASQNRAPTNHGPWRFAYQKARREWVKEFRSKLDAGLVTRADGRRVVRMTRLYSGRKREWDRGNLIGGMKLVLDAMSRPRAAKQAAKGVIDGVGLIVDDSPKWLLDVYEQERTEMICGMRFEFWNLPEAK